MRALGVLALTGLVLIGCREDAGVGDYSTHGDLRERNLPPPFLDGPTPFVPGVPRLGIGLFYEGPTTDKILVDAVTSFYFIFDTAGDGSGQLTFSQETSSDRVEGTLSDRIIHGGTGFLGGGVFWYTARNVSQYSTLNLSLKSSDAAFAEITLSVESGPDRPADGMNDAVETFAINASSYGYMNDGEWHNLTIPISDLEALGFNASSVRSPLIFGAGAGASGESFLIDDVYIQ